MNRTILIVGGGIEAVPGIRLAKEMGLHVVVSDKNPDAPGFSIADDKLVVSTYDINETISAAMKYNRTVRTIDGVMCMASDVPMTVAEVASALNLPGITVQSAQLSADKLAMKYKFSSDKVPTPWFSPVEDVEHLLKLVSQIGYPLVLKPIDNRGARGVLRLTTGLDLKWAFSFSREYSPTGRLMVEQFLEGPQVSTESMILGGMAYTPGFSDRNYEFLSRYSPYIIENGGELPSFLPHETQKSIFELVQKAAQSLEVKTGIVKSDIVVCNGVPYVIEIAPRLSGGYFCSHEIPLNTGVNFIEQAILLALGEKINPEDLIPKFQKAVAQRYFFPEAGRVISIKVPDVFRNDPDIAMLEIRVKEGDIIMPITNHPTRAGVVITTGETREKAIQKAQNVAEQISIITDNRA